MSAVEQFTSRQGSDISRTRRFLVTTTNAFGKEDPLTDSQLPPIGTGHSKFPGLVAKTRVIAQRLGLKTFLVDVPYGLPSSLTPSFGGLWEVSASGSTESHRQNFATLDQQQINDGVEPEIVGPYEYVEDESGEFETTTKRLNETTGLVEPKIITLRRLATRKKDGMDVTGGVGTLNLKRRFSRNINFGRAMNIMSMVNSDIFYGAAPGQLKFTSINMVPVLVTVSENPYGIGHDVYLSFQWRAVGHQHTTVHTYISPDGTESVVRRATGERGGNPPVIETFSRYLGISFNALLSEL